MCAPDYFQVLYEINPWMKVARPVNVERAHAQWQGLYLTLQGLGAKVSLIPQEPNCPDMVFTANGGIVRGKTFIPAHFRFPQRRLEEDAFIRFFRRKGYTILDAAQGAFFEGEGDLLSWRDWLFGGYRFRSELSAHERIAKALKKKLIPLELAQPHFYHLDTCFFPLDHRSVIYFPGAFDQRGRDAILKHVEQPISVSKEDAHRFACNGIRIGRTIVLNKASAAFKRRMEREQYEVLEIPTGEFIKSGGSAKCLVLHLDK